MPGIVGLITKLPREIAERQLNTMLAALLHEDFYSSGTLVDEKLGIYVGWIAIKGSSSEKMPIADAKGEVALVFCGEEYSSGVRSVQRSTDDQNYLLRWYAEDPEFPAGLNGMFQGLLLDRRSGSAILFNDRFGMHRICYHESEASFYFASEAKAILAIKPELRRADADSLGEFVACGCVLNNRTIFRDIYVLPQGSAWVFQNGELNKKTYFEPREWEEQSSLEPEAYYRALCDALQRNLPAYFNGSQPIAMTLTGGLDTRVLMAWHKASPGSLPGYTFGGQLRDSQDVIVARRVAHESQQPHQVLELGSEFLAAFPQYAERTVHLSEGTADVYRASDLYFSQKARQIAPVKVVGTYGSELIRHAVMLSAVSPMPRLYSSDFLPHIQTAARSCAQLESEHPVTFVAFRQSPWQHQGILSIERTQLIVRSPFLDNDFVRTVFRAPKSDPVHDDVRLRLIRDGDPNLAAIRTDRGIGGDAGRFFSGATRALLEFTVKTEYAFDYGMPQWFAPINHALRFSRIENLFLGRHKSAYFRIWYRDVLASHVREILLDSRTLTRPYLNSNALTSIVEGHLSGKRNYTREIHKLLTLELLHRLFFDAK